MTNNPSRKTVTIKVCPDANTRSLIEAAAKSTGKSVARFLLDSARDRAADLRRQTTRVR